ncbi:hypothetical protein PCH_Pc16g00010 [Penicillium rubens Wisconsin 54-1255]|uniref:Uncharacterized protein n=1 Tax=Penicillium rubens (strain ATCC 28089 / DSM 1075 / NRRL 1951 / Wisconsin 54-1255) TaxID=500485 RepID=B6H6R5_PENRW|nr:hypothetical protein PCH_Pc16g00010 [Penicillium rubens Wisconsin 54-1255]
MSLSFSKKWPTLYGDFAVHGPPPYKNCPPEQFLATSTAFCIFTPQMGSCWGGSPTAVVSSGTQQRLIPPMTSSPRSALGPLGGHSAPGLVVMGALAELLPGASAVVTEARGPFGARHRWSLWIDGRWPYPKPRFLEGAAPWDPPFAGVVHGVWTLHPRATCRSLPAPSRAPGPDPLRADWC